MTDPTREEIIKALRHIAEISTSKNITCTNAANLIESDSARIAELEAENGRLKEVNEALENDKYNNDMNLAHLSQEYAAAEEYIEGLDHLIDRLRDRIDRINNKAVDIMESGPYDNADIKLCTFANEIFDISDLPRDEPPEESEGSK